MERQQASQFDQQILDLYDDYAHGRLSRRDYIQRLSAFAVGGITVEMLLANFTPNYAWAQQVPADDPRIRTKRRRSWPGSEPSSFSKSIWRASRRKANKGKVGPPAETPGHPTMNTSLRNLTIVSLCVLHSWALIPVLLSADWPQFRGPQARGIAEHPNLPERWSATENVAWKADVPGRGWSSPIIVGDRLFLTTVVNLGKSEEPKKGLYFGGNRPEPPQDVHQWLVICLDASSGRELWRKIVHEGKPAGAIHLKNSLASETPVSDNQRIYCYFGNQGVHCLSMDGDVVWSKPIQATPTRYGWGTAASPVLHGQRLYLVNDNEERSYLLALDKETGKEVWQVERDEKSNWATPYIWQNELRTEIVTPGTGKVRSYDLDGEELWSLTGMSSITIATPYEHEGLLYISSGYILDSARPLYAIRPGASGDISLSDGSTSNDWIAWSQPTAAPYNPSTLVYRDRLYVLYDRGFFGCFDAATGAEIYERQRIPNGHAFTSSPWAYNGKIFCLNEDGETFVIGAGDQFEILHVNPLAKDDMCMATPAIAGDRLFIRTSARIYCMRKQGN